jgi:hypothetical protein
MLTLRADRAVGRLRRPAARGDLVRDRCPATMLRWHLLAIPLALAVMAVKFGARNALM